MSIWRGEGTEGWDGDRWGQLNGSPLSSLHITSLISMENNDGLSFETGGN